VTAAALAYTALALVAAMFQMALVFGAPWGHMTMAGQYPGRLPPRRRAWALVSALLLGAMALVMLDAAGLLTLGIPAWALWAALGLTALTTVANWITPSRPERLLWGPVTLAMLVAAGVIVLG
jgi:hypothetical protein